MDVAGLASRALLGSWNLEDLVAYDFFKYTPSTALAAIALALYAVAAAVVGCQTWKSGWRYIHTVTITGLIEAAGYSAMLATIQLSGKTNIYGAYVAMQVFIVLSPNLLQASLYWTVGNLLAASPELTQGKKMLGRKVITFTFAGADLFALVVQAIGISLWATAKSSSDGSESQFNLGNRIMLAGLAIQLFCFILFTLLAIWVHRHPKNVITGTHNLRKLYTGIYIATVFLFVRNIFRLVEFTQTTILGLNPSDDVYILANKEVLFYTLDTTPILLCFLAFIAYHPGWYLPKQAQLAGLGDQQNEKQFVVAGDRPLEAGKQVAVVADMA